MTMLKYQPLIFLLTIEITSTKEKIFTYISKSGILFCLDLHETRSYHGSHAQNL